MAKSKTINKYITNKYTTKDYTLTYRVEKINDKHYAIIYGIEDLSEEFKLNGNLIIPSKIEKLDVYAIGGSAFSHNTLVQNITFEEGIKEIKGTAFYFCENLKSISFPKSLTSIGYSAFEMCTRLKDVDFSEGLEIIECSAFEGTGLEKISLPDSVTKIYNGAFRGSKISSAHIGPNVEFIDSSVFMMCENLVDVNLSEGIKTIDDYVFKQCYKLKSVVLPESVTSLGYGAFDYCPSLKSVRMGSCIQFKGRSTSDFAYGCSSLSKIIISPAHPSLKMVGDSLYNTKNKTLIKVISSAKDKKVVIPNWVQTVCDCCFDDVSLDALIIKPKELYNIANGNLDNIKHYYCVPGSEVERFLTNYGYKNIHPIQSELDVFLDKLSGEEKIF